VDNQDGHGSPSGPTVPSSREDALRRAADLGAALRGRAGETEELRRLPDATVAELRDTGLLGVMTPKRWGGSELGAETMIDVTATLAAACASTGWVYMLWTAHCWMLALFPERAQEELWPSPNVLASSVVSTAGEVETVAGGYRWTGRGFFSSGVDHSEWLTAAVEVRTDDGSHRRWLLIPRADYTIIDDWNTVGLRGTGSKTVVFEDIFIPEYRTLAHADSENGTAPGSHLHENPMFCGTSTVNFTAAMAAPALGVATGFCESFAERLAGKAGPEPAHPFAAPGLAATAARFAEASASVDAALALAREHARSFSAVPARDVAPSARARFRRDQAFCAQAARRAVNMLYEEGGAGSLANGSLLQRLWRDTNAAAAHHGLTWDWQAENWTQNRLADLTDAVTPARGRS
jgi:alkylation response protein AidB-like acyl-CoA dehydrogenase